MDGNGVYTGLFFLTMGHPEDEKPRVSSEALIREKKRKKKKLRKNNDNKNALWVHLPTLTGRSDKRKRSVGREVEKEVEKEGMERKRRRRRRRRRKRMKRQVEKRREE
uniref:Uncharacterized protein n=1 Tax=Vespula pensylvanica TaxID=30213 RepID=A0A834U7P6_VESPE|nr:hypothetical protein H0235_010651 [Vespula pensylvanica]